MLLLEDCVEFKVDRSHIITEAIPGTDRSVSRMPGRLSVSGVVNGNRRRYPRSVWEKNLREDSPLSLSMKRRSTFGLLEHPADGKVDLRSPIAIITVGAKLNESGEVLGEIIVVNTPEGLKLRALVEAGYDPYVSSRGYGSLTKASDGVDDVADDYVCEGWDVVMRPSFVAAKLTPRRESLEDPALDEIMSFCDIAALTKPETLKTVASAYGLNESQLLTLRGAVEKRTKAAQRGQLQHNFASYQEFVEHCGVHHLHQLLKFDTPRKAWDANPLMEWTPAKNDLKVSTVPLTEGSHASTGLKLTLVEWAKPVEPTAPPAPVPAPAAPAAAPASVPTPAPVAPVAPAPVVEGTPSSAIPPKPAVAAEDAGASKPVGTPPGQPRLESEQGKVTVDIKDIRAEVDRLTALDPAKIAPRQFAAGIAQFESLHTELGKFLAEHQGESWAVTKLHESITALETKWAEAFEAPRQQVAKLTESNGKLCRVLKAVVEAASGYRTGMTQLRQQLTEGNELTQAAIARGRGWRQRALVLDGQLEVASRASDMLAEMYKEDLTAVGRALVEKQFADKLALPENKPLTETLAAASHPNQVIRIREQLEGKKPGGKTPITEGGKGKQAPAAPAPAPAPAAPAPAGKVVMTEARGPSTVADMIGTARRLHESQSSGTTAK